MGERCVSSVVFNSKNNQLDKGKACPHKFGKFYTFEDFDNTFFLQSGITVMIS